MPASAKSTTFAATPETRTTAAAFVAADRALTAAHPATAAFALALRPFTPTPAFAVTEGVHFSVLFQLSSSKFSLHRLFAMHIRYILMLSCQYLSRALFPAAKKQTLAAPADRPTPHYFRIVPESIKMVEPAVSHG
jgi:hypothetical protein